MCVVSVTQFRKDPDDQNCTGGSLLKEVAWWPVLAAPAPGVLRTEHQEFKTVAFCFLKDKKLNLIAHKPYMVNKTDR